MKRLLLSLVTLCLFSSLGAELYVPNRYVELGVEASAGASNNLYGASDILTETITIDLKKIAGSLGRNGFVIDAFADTNAFFNLNLGTKFRLGLFANVSGSAFVGVGKEFFEVLADGWDLGETKEFSATAYGDLFVNVGASFHTTIKEKYGITIIPTYVMPVAYADDASAKVDFFTDESGPMRASAEASFALHTAFDLEDFSYDDIMSTKISDLVTKGGFDLGFSVERPTLKSLDVGIYGRIPIIPGRLNYKTTRTMTATFTQDNLIQCITDGEDFDYEYDEGVTEYSKSTKYVFRPLRLGLEAAWHPFGNWCVFRPKVGLAVRHPYSKKAIFYPEYALDANITLFKVLGFQFGTAYEDRIFVQRAGIMLNARIFQIDVKALFRSEDFINSFRFAGAGAYVGLRVGF
ncbi:MAG: hypothetical protein K2O09_04375 [Treponemataceae bacterium]|nr:hypothetical protein [Treponemataceae bacterium]